MQEHLFSHFSIADHDGFLNDVSISFIDKTDPSDPSWRDYWRQTLKTMVLYGLNMEDCLMGVFVFTFLHGNVSFLHGNVSMFLGFLFRNNRVCFVGLYRR